MKTWIAAAAIALAAGPAGAQSIFLGENALALAAAQGEGATREAAAEILREILARLEVPEERRAQYRFVSSARLIRAPKYFEADELSEAVVLAAGSVRISFARNVLVISGGDVDVAHAAGLVVIARGNLRISHENSLPGVEKPAGVYIVRGRVEMSHARAPIIYAVGGAKTGYSGPVTAYNTDVNVPDGVRVVSMTRPALFLGEPIRKPGESHMLVNSGETMPYGGQRCALPRREDDVSLLNRMLPYVRREADCPRIESATVECLSGEGAQARFRSEERWLFRLCGKTAEVRSVQGPNHRGMHLERLSDAKGAVLRQHGAQPAPRFAAPKLSPEDQKRVSALFKEALQHMMRGELSEAKQKYLDVLAIAEHPSARHNLESLERRLARADEATARYTSRIEAGYADARTYADRGLAYIRLGDLGRGLADLDRAHDMANTDAGIAVDRAWGALIANRLAQAEHYAGQVIGRNPRHARAYEIRAWAHVLQNRPALGYKDAFSSLVEAPAWTPQSFGEQKAGYRVLAGYLALRQHRHRERAAAWLREWRPMLRADRWPDALLLFLLGDLPEPEMTAVAEALSAEDRGAAGAEAVTFLAVDERLGGAPATREAAEREYYRKRYSAGYTLALVINLRQKTPGQAIQLSAD